MADEGAREDGTESYKSGGSGTHRGQGEFISGGASDSVDHTTLSMTIKQVTNLHNPEAPEWEQGYLNLTDGRRMPLWSDFYPAPTINLGETEVAFATRTRVARRLRASILGNRSERVEEARRAHLASRRIPTSG